MHLNISVLARRPELFEASLAMENPWPKFMRQDPIGDLYYAPKIMQAFAEHILVGQDDDGEVIAKALCVPFLLEGEELPDDGWDGAIRRAALPKLTGDKPNSIAALEIRIATAARGRGFSQQVLAALRDNAREHGFRELTVPVRPTGKRDVHQPMTQYASQTREDGLPVDPWLRVHVRAGGRIDKVAARSMVIPGTLSEWREWTGLPFDSTGPVEVPEALAPVHCDVEHDTAVYIEPNVWVRHSTGI